MTLFARPYLLSRYDPATGGLSIIKKSGVRSEMPLLENSKKSVLIIQIINLNLIL